ncbi:hypothetical protein RHMOL_Rhmol12G0091900 [Rhododendron molle]|uniref:Uncharacterized protein n=1 Tax=Rhododendron molle TaxID=49168 RepID=A0ACC0LH96_RHOML|nr:hypothetical protein RHMOL_Rhmol12G0091900 [Rhododendron molle]
MASHLCYRYYCSLHPFLCCRSTLRSPVCCPSQPLLTSAPLLLPPFLLPLPLIFPS